MGSEMCIRDRDTISGTSFSHLLKGVCCEMVMPSEGAKITTLPSSVVLDALVEDDVVDETSSPDVEQAVMVRSSPADAVNASSRFAIAVQCNVMPSFLRWCL